MPVVVVRSASVSFELPLPAFVADEPPRQDSDAGAYLRQLLLEALPHADIVSIARRPGVLAKVAVRAGSVSGDVIAQLRDELGGERIEVVPWQAQPRAFIATALGLPEVPPMLLKPVIRHAVVLVGEIDVRGMNGWRGINRLLASALTGWRIHLRAVSETPAWTLLEGAMAERRAVAATVIGPTPRGLCLDVHGLHALLPRATGRQPGDELAVRVTRMDADEGKIIVSQHLARTGQLALPR